jgi:choline dehydrogenase-like flavoprotein
MADAEHFDLILVGTGFACSAFLHEALTKLKPGARILALERGQRHTHAEYTANSHQLSRESRSQIVNHGDDKEWNYLFMYGGSSNCWWANTPRMIPDDFSTRTKFGVGQDWPISYADIEPHYCRAEELLGIAGDNDLARFMPRSRPFPQPMHVMSDPDKLFRKAYPEHFFGMPSARASVATDTRPRCCASGVCNVCPVGAKTTVLNSFSHLYSDPRVTLKIGAKVETIEWTGSVATGVVYEEGSQKRTAKGDLIALGANGIFNPHLLLRSGVEQHALGRGITEQVAIFAVAYLNGVQNFQGSTTRCGHGYMLHKPEDRRRRAPALLLTHNTIATSKLRPLRGRWREILGLTICYEDLRNEANYVKFNPGDPERPEIVYGGRSQYAKDGLKSLEDELPQVLSALPIDGYRIFAEPHRSESHLIGTTVMGDDPEASVVDRHLIHHKLRNLVVLGSGAFPTAAPANPTLTLSALSLWAADKVFSSR